LPFPSVVIGDATLYLGDCREILPTLPKVDACITDPPYGIGADTHAGPEKSGWKQYGDGGWDAARPEAEIFGLMLAASKTVIVWGGNYFTDLLPPTMQWLVWDKGQRNFSLADCEFAWSSQTRAARIFTYSRGAALQDGKEHPTQKPIALMEWCIEQAANKPRTILDPFMGSGTTGVAAMNLQREFIGIEIHKPYFDIACERIAAAYAQQRLFA
jgi:DNA modification methylase